MSIAPSSPVERFFVKVDRLGGNTPAHAPQLGPCWLWFGAQNALGYGAFWDGTRTVGAHRFAFELENGKIPDGSFVLHHCDNPPCVRATHLYLGDAADNMRDVIARGRLNVADHRGPFNPRAVLDSLDVQDIRELFAAGRSIAALARLYGLSKTGISHVVYGETWADAGGPIASPKPLLSDSVRREIHKARREGNVVRVISERYGVPETTVARIAADARWEE